MALWSSIPFPNFPDNVLLQRIRVSLMPYPIMQGVDQDGRPFLAQKVMYENEPRVGFIIERNENEYEYGLLEHMDLWVKGVSNLNNSYSESYVKQLQYELITVKQELCALKQSNNLI